MLKDDRMMGMLTFVVIMLAVGTLVQRADLFNRFFGEPPPPKVLVADEAEVRATKSVTLDVLANDEELEPADAERLTIVSPPACGRALVRDGQINYLGTHGCVGEQRLTYGLAGEQGEAELRLTVRLSREDQRLAQREQEKAQKEAQEAAEREAQRESELAAQPTPAADPVPAAQAAAPAARAEPAPSEPAPTEPAAAEPPATAGARDETPVPDATRTAACEEPATVTLDLQPAAMTRVAIDSPCHAGEVAELTYGGLRLALPLDAEGTGSLAVPGFGSASNATLTLEGHNPKEFVIPFRDTERLERVAVAWERPAGLALGALELGAGPDRRARVVPDAPRSFEAVRRRGGGWLSLYHPAEGRGQRVEVYSFWRRYGGPTGVIRLGFDLAAPDCAAAAPGNAGYTVLRMSAGHPQPARQGRVAPLDCAALAARGQGASAGLIDEAVDDLIVRRR